MTAPSALLSIQDGAGAVEPQGQGYIQQLVPGDIAKFTLQSTAGITPSMRWSLVFESPDTPNLDGLAFSWSPNNSGVAPEFDVNLPPSGFTARYVTTIFDIQNALSQFTGEIIGIGGGGGGGGGGGSTITADFVQPAVGSSQTMVLVSTAGILAGDSITLVGGGRYVVVGTPADAQHLVALNLGTSGNATPGMTIAKGATLSLGNNAPLAAQARLNGQALQLVGGVDTPTGISPIINATSFGAVGDGVTDDRAAIQAALDSVPVGGLQEVLLPVNANQYQTANQLCTMYAISGPLCVHDNWTLGAPRGSQCSKFRGTSQLAVGLQATNLGAYIAPTWFGPLILVGSTSDGATATYVTDSGQTCIVSGDTATPTKPYVNLSEWDVGDINGQIGFCWEEWYNPITETLSPGAARQLASSWGDIKFEHHQAFKLERTNTGGGTNIHGTLTTTAGGGSTTSVGAQTMPVFNVPTTLNFAGSVPNTPGLWLTVAGIGILQVVSSGGTAVVVINQNLTGNVAAGTAITNGTAVQIEGTASVFTTAGHDIPASTLTHIALDWDGSNLRLWVDGAQPDGTMTAALSGGSILQKWYEETVTMQSQYGTWPSMDGTLSGFSGTLFHQGKTRLSNASQYSAPFTPNPANVTCNSTCKLLLDFSVPAPSQNGFANRVSTDTEWIIGRTSAEYALRPRNNVPVWLHLNITQVPYTNDAEVSDLYLSAVKGSGIELNCALNSHIHHITFSSCSKGLNFHYFCYGSHYDHLNFLNCGVEYYNNTQAHFGGAHSWDIIHHNGSQDMLHGVNIRANSCTSAWHLVSMFSDCTIAKTCFIPTCTQGAFLFGPDTSTVVDQGALIDDEGGSQQYATYMFMGAGSFSKQGGAIFCANLAVPNYKIGNVRSVRVSGTSYASGAQPIFSGGLAYGGVPVQWDGDNNFDSTAVIDPLNPVGLFIPSQESFGVKTVTFPSDANYTLPQEPTADAFWYQYQIAAGTISTTRSLTWPANPGKTYNVRNNNLHTVNLTRVGSSSPYALLTTLAVTVYDNGTDLVAL